MPSGKLGSASLLATTEATLYTVPVDIVATVNINVVNRNTEAAKVRIAIGSGANAVVADYIEYDTSLPPNGVLERMGFALSAGEKVFAYSDKANVTVRVHGFEE